MRRRFFGKKTSPQGRVFILHELVWCGGETYGNGTSKKLLGEDAHELDLVGVTHSFSQFRAPLQCTPLGCSTRCSPICRRDLLSARGSCRTHLRTTTFPITNTDKSNSVAYRTATATNFRSPLRSGRRTPSGCLPLRLRQRTVRPQRRPLYDHAEVYPHL